MKRTSPLFLSLSLPLVSSLAAAQSAPPRTTAVHFESADPSLTLSESKPQSPELPNGDRPPPKPICMAPCDARVLPGAHTFALSLPGGSAVVTEPVNLDGAVALRGEYTSHATRRTAGWIVGGASLVAGVLLLATVAWDGSSNCNVDFQTAGAAGVPADCSSHSTDARLALGFSVLAVGGIVATVLLSQGDEAALRVVPLTTALAHYSRLEQESAAPGGLTPPAGLSVEAAF